MQPEEATDLLAGQRAAAGFSRRIKSRPSDLRFKTAEFGVASSGHHWWTAMNRYAELTCLWNLRT